MSKWYPGLDAPLPMPSPWRPHEIVEAKPRAPIQLVKMVSLAKPWRPNPILVMGLACAAVCWLMRDFWIGAWWIGPGW
jgi:hypothetical protein